MIATEAPPSASRLAKFDRVLAKLVLDRTVFTRSQPIVVYLDSPIDELCDVTFRLTHNSGRTYAEARVQLDPETRSVALGTALNLPDGEYDIIATPPLAEFFSTTPVERRLPCRIAASPYFDMPTGTYAERRTETLQEIAARGPASMARLARLALEGYATPALLAQVLDQVKQNAAGFVRAAGTYLDSEVSRGDVEAQLLGLGTRGIDFNGPALEATIVALAALIEGARDGQVAELSAVAMDKLVFCLAMNCARGVYGAPGPSPAISARVEPLSGATRLIWGVGGFNANVAAPLALALALAENYEVPPLLQAIALDEAEGTSVQRHTADGEAATFNTWRRGAAMLSSSSRSWLASLGPDARIFASVEAETVVHRETALAARYAEAAAGMMSIAFPFWAFEETVVASHWAFGRVSDGYVALHAANGLDRPREHHASALLSPAAGNLLVCHLGTASADGGFEAFQARVEALRVTVSGSGFVAETLRGAPLATANRSLMLNAHIRSAYCTSDAGDTTMEIRFGADGMRLDFSPPGEPHDGDQK